MVDGTHHLKDCPRIMLPVIVHKNRVITFRVRQACHLGAGLAGVFGKVNPRDDSGVFLTEGANDFEGAVWGGIIDQDDFR